MQCLFLKNDKRFATIFIRKGKIKTSAGLVFYVEHEQQKKRGVGANFLTTFSIMSEQLNPPHYYNKLVVKDPTRKSTEQLHNVYQGKSALLQPL